VTALRQPKLSGPNYQYGVRLEVSTKILGSGTRDGGERTFWHAPARVVMLAHNVHGVQMVAIDTVACEDCDLRGAKRATNHSDRPRLYRTTGSHSDRRTCAGPAEGVSAAPAPAGLRDSSLRKLGAVDVG
jgi:hypothetical protein